MYIYMYVYDIYNQYIPLYSNKFDKLDKMGIFQKKMGIFLEDKKIL